MCDIFQIRFLLQPPPPEFAVVKTRWIRCSVIRDWQMTWKEKIYPLKSLRFEILWTGSQKTGLTVNAFCFIYLAWDRQKLKRWFGNKKFWAFHFLNGFDFQVSTNFLVKDFITAFLFLGQSTIVILLLKKAFRFH